MNISAYSTGIITSGYTILSSSLYKVGKIVFMNLYLRVNNVVTPNTRLATIPQGFRPKNNTACTAHLFGGGDDGIQNFLYVLTDGMLKEDYSTTLNIKSISIIGSWYTEE